MAVDTKREDETKVREEERRGGVPAQRETKDLVVNPQGVPQATFPSTMKQGVAGMINSMVDYNAISRNCATAAGIPAARAVSQGTLDTDAVIGGTANGFLGLTILDPTLYNPDPTKPDQYAQYMEMGILTKGEMFASCVVACVAGDPLSFVAADGTLTNTGAVVVPGGRWKYTRATPGDLNVVQLGIQR
jgi:hypothetical protein